MPLDSEVLGVAGFVASSKVPFLSSNTLHWIIAMGDFCGIKYVVTSMMSLRNGIKAYMQLIRAEYSASSVYKEISVCKCECR